MNDDFLYIDEEVDILPKIKARWNVLIVDDEKEVHNVTRLALNDFVLDGGSINFISVYSGAEAIKFLTDFDDRSIAIILLDVVMESNRAGLDVANFVRGELDNHFTRIILRTGQPADIPEKDVVMKYDINDYKAKAELTFSRLFITMVTNLRAYEELSQRKKRELELQESKVAVEKANKAKSTFIARMNHELLTPLNAIIGFSQIQELYLKNHKMEVEQELASDILKAGYHLKMLIEDILDLTQMQNPIKKLHLEPCSLKKLISESISLVKFNAEQKGVRINISQTNLVVNANFDRLKQCLVNLLSNAIKFNKNNGEITIQVQEVELQKVKILVNDTGVGIAIEDQDDIFEKFNRLHYAEKQEIQGSGIGLSLIKQLVLLMGGEVGLSSKFNSGSTFWLCFDKV